jgi:hypothetical protein
MWSKHAVTAFDCPHITPAQIEEVVQRYGEKHPLTRSMVYGEFVDIGAESLVISSDPVAELPQPTPRL